MLNVNELSISSFLFFLLFLRGNKLGWCGVGVEKGSFILNVLSSAVSSFDYFPW